MLDIMRRIQPHKPASSPRMRGSHLLIFAVLGWFVMHPALSAHAHSTQSGDIKIGHVWADIATQRDGRIDVYLPIYNGGTEAELLVAVTSPDAEKSVLVTAEGEQSAVNLPIPSRKPVNLTERKPFLRLMGLKRSYQPGEEIPLTFQFTYTPPATIAAHMADKANH